MPELPRMPATGRDILLGTERLVLPQHVQYQHHRLARKRVLHCKADQNPHVLVLWLLSLGGTLPGVHEVTHRQCNSDDFGRTSHFAAQYPA